MEARTSPVPLFLAAFLCLTSGCYHLLPTPTLSDPPVPPVTCHLLPPVEECGTLDASPRARTLTPSELFPGALIQPIDLPTALRLADAKNPEINLAREKIREAQAIQDRFEVLWLPHLDFAPNWNRHDGQIQRASGEVITRGRSSLFVGGGPSLTLDLRESVFGNLAARQVTTARLAGASAVTNERLRDVAVAYIDLLQAHAELQIAQETYENARGLQELMESFERSGKAAAADVARARTEANSRERERLEARGRIRLVSARVAQLLLLPADLEFQPIEPAVVPVSLVAEQIPLNELVIQGLRYRPELQENQALVEAAVERWRAAKLAPLMPALTVNYSAGGFGGGPDGFFGNFGGRGDFTALAQWRLENFGLGTAARQRERHSQFQQIVFQQSAAEAQIASQVAAAFSQSYVRRHELPAAQGAVEAARESYRLNRDRIRRAPEQGRPIELLQAIQALFRARQDYLQVVSDYNRWQFRLYAAMGNPPGCSLEEARQIHINEPVLPK